jgi:hypothetical protein
LLESHLHLSACVTRHMRSACACNRWCIGPEAEATVRVVDGLLLPVDDGTVGIALAPSTITEAADCRITDVVGDIRLAAGLVDALGEMEPPC